VSGSIYPIITDEPLTNDAAKLGDTLFKQGSFEEWTEVLKTNTVAPYFVTMGFLSLLERGARTRKGETSSVINISSVSGTINLTAGFVSDRKIHRLVVRAHESDFFLFFVATTTSLLIQ
jgi:NAD(P)-dependent dehydrogenase (short-subunit alcohol dehydrogenase family)